MKYNVVVVEDDRRLRTQLKQILDGASDIKCVGLFSSAEDALHDIPALCPDVVLMDIGLPGMSGIECVAELRKMLPKVHIIIVTVYEDSERILQALKAGATGYLVKSGPPKQLLEAIRDVHSGGSPISSHIARKIVYHFHVIGLSALDQETLSDREEQVLDLLATGFLYKEIGDKLSISPETVRVHVKNICSKLHVRNRIEAVAKRRV